MIVCQICGDKGYSNLLVNCVQCQNVAVHRYCVVGPAIFNDEGFKWSCEDCVLRNTKPASPRRKSERLISTVKRITTRNKTRKQQRNNLSSPQVQNRAGFQKENFDQKKKEGSVKRTQAQNKERRNPVLQNALDATEFIHKELISDNDLKKGSSEAVPISGQKIENVSTSDGTGLEQVKLVKNVSSLSSKVQDVVKSKEHRNPVLQNALDATEVNHKKLNSNNDLKKGSSEAVQIGGQKIENVNSADRTGLEQVKLVKNVDSLSSKVQDVVKNTERRNCVLQYALDATEVIHKKLNSNNSLKEGSSEAVQLRGQKIENVNSSDKTGLVQSKLVKNVGSPSSKVQDLVKESAGMTAGDMQGESKSSKEQNLTDVSLCRNEDRIDENMFSADEGGHEVTGSEKSSCDIHPKILEEMHINKNYSQDSDCADQADTKKSGVEETKVDVSDRQAPRKRRRLIIEMDYSDEEPVFVVAKRPQHVADSKDPLCKSSSEAVSKLSDAGLAQISSMESVPRSSPMKVDDCVLPRERSVVFDNHGLVHLSSVNLIDNFPAQPLYDVAWRGYCKISDNEYSTPLVLEAHLSNKAHENVHDAVPTLPELLNFDFVPKKYAWPKDFEKPCLTGDEIGLYLFPVDERDERSYECIIDKMNDNDLMLKSRVNNLELLVFCSLELPREERTFRRNYYLWGVFKPWKEPIMPNEPSNSHTSNARLPKPMVVPAPAPAEYSSDGIYHPKDVGTTRVMNSSLCPSSLDDNIRAHQKDVRLPLERPRDKRGYNSHQKGSSNRHLPHRENYDRRPRKFRKTHDRERHRDAEFSGYDREQNRRWKKRTSKWKDRGFKDSRHSYRRY